MFFKKINCFVFLFCSLFGVSFTTGCWWFDSSPDYRLILQGQFAPPGTNLSSLCVNNQAMSMFGSSLGCPGGNDPIELDEFLDHSEDEIRFWMESLYNTNPEFNDPNLYLSFNCEYPIHPNQWGTYNDNIDLQNQYFDSLALRFKIFREYFPLPIISLGPFNGSGNAGTPPSLLEKIEGYQRAGERGVFDDLTCLETRIYFHKGPDDSDNYLEITKLYAIQSLEIAASLTNSFGSNLPLCVVSSFINTNGASANHGDPISIEQGLVQLEVIQNHPQVLLAGWWDGEFNPELQFPFLEGLNLCGN